MFSFRKSVWKTKTIEDQGQKQVEALKEQAKAYEEKSDNKLSMQKKIFNRLLKERRARYKK